MFIYKIYVFIYKMAIRKYTKKGVEGLLEN